MASRRLLQLGSTAALGLGLFGCGGGATPSALSAHSAPSAAATPATSLPAGTAFEIGHSAGFRHSFDWPDVMYPYNRSTVAFGLNERVLLGMLFERPGGNRFPDNDRGVPSAVRETVTIVCR
jgi:hypothetical protein